MRTKFNGKASRPPGRSAMVSLICPSLLALVACGGGGQGLTPIRTAFNKGVYHFSLGEYDEAIAEYRLALEEDASDYRARFNLAVTQEAQADVAGDAAIAARLRQEAEDQYRLLLTHRPFDLRASINLAAREYHEGLKDQALARLRATSERYPNVVSPQVSLAAHLLREAGVGRGGTVPPASAPILAEAQRVLEEALRKNPTHVEGRMLLGDVYSAQANADPGPGVDELRALARDAYRAALRREPSDIATLLSLARLEMAHGDFASAVVWLKRVIYVDGDHFEAHWLLAETHAARGELEEATWHLWKARDRNRGRVPRPDYRGRLIELYRRLLDKEMK